MDRAKPEPVPEGTDGTRPAATTATDGASAGRGARGGRGRGRGRARGRGRRVVPRQVARRKPPPQAAQPAPPPPAQSTRGRGRGRGQDGRGRGRGIGQRPSSYNPNIVGLGQIAPVRPPNRIPSSGGSAATSRKSSVVSSMSIGAASSTNAASSSTGVEVDVSQPDGMRNPDGSFSAQGGIGASPTENGAKTQKAEQKYISFLEHMEVADDSDDDMKDDAFEARNSDIAPYAGKLTRDGLLLPVSLPGLRDLPPEYEVFESKKPSALVEDEDEESLTVPGTKDEPMEIDTMDGALRPEMFQKGSVARKVLAGEDSLAFMQLPGLLALMERNEAEGGRKENAEDADQEKVESSVAAAMAAAERMRGLGTDMRKVGDKGSTRPIGKLRFFKSGRVQIVMERGGCIELEHGITPKASQQVVLIDTERNTCEELQNTLTSRFVGVPSFGPT